MATNNATNTSNPVSVPQGGTGLSSNTAYTVMCGGTTSTAAFQNVSSVGSTGNVLTSNGASALPSFQAAGGGGFVFLTTTTVSAQTSAVISSGFSATYINYAIFMNDVLPATDGANFLAEVSTDGGSTWKTTGYDSQGWYYQTASNAEENATDRLMIGNAQHNVNVGGGHMFIYNIGTSTSSNVEGSYVEKNTSNSIRTYIFASALPTSISINAIRFRMSSGNISGTFRLYGITT